MNAKELSSLTNNELVEKLASLKQELFNLRFSHATGSLSNPLAINVCKKNIAKVNTILRERELGIAKTQPAQEATTKTKKSRGNK
ncbi:MAG: 50S ribosomal protein L29 [Clostridia bacterium]|nr:50S ribosomal protein L29 [Clostridia bacterium]